MYILIYFLPFLFPLVTNSWPKTIDKNSPFSTDQAPIVPTNEIHSRQKRIVEIVLGGLFAGALVKRHYRRKMKKYKRKLRMAKYGQMDPYSAYGKYPRPYPYHHRSYRPNRDYRRLQYPSDYFPSEFGQKQRMDGKMEMIRRNGQQSKLSKEKMSNLNGVYPNSSLSNTMPDQNVPPVNSPMAVSPVQNTMTNTGPNPTPTTSKGFFGSTLGAIGQKASAAAAFSQPFVQNVAPTVIKTGLTTAGSALGLAALGPVGAAGAGYAINSATDYLSNSLFPQNNAAPPNPINSPSNPTTTS